MSRLLLSVLSVSLLCLAGALVVSGSSGVGGACPAESLRRVHLCQKVLRTFLQPNPDPTQQQVVPFAQTWSSSAICATLTKSFTKTVPYDACLSLAGHLFGASGSSSPSLVELSRKQDIHDTCVYLLAKPFAGVTPMTAQDAAVCTLAATGGVTGLRALFLHGMGGNRLAYKSTSPSGSLAFDGWLGRFSKYWRTEEELDGLADVRFYVAETVFRGWADISLQTEYCAQIARFNPHVVVSHSMGGMIIAAAIANKIGACAKISKTPGPGQIMWITSQTPWLGSPAADSTIRACVGGAKGLGNQLRQFIIKKSEDCGSVGAAIQSLDLTYTAPGAIQMSGLKAVARQHLSGNMCGISSTPLLAKEAFSMQGAGLWVLGKLGAPTKLIQWGADTVTKMTAPFAGNDGLVTMQSCNLEGGIQYTSHYADAFYVGAFSHGDGPCFVKDSPLNNEARQPCQWYVGRVNAARRTFGVTSIAVGAGAINPHQSPAFAATYSRSFLQMEDAISLEAYEARELRLHQAAEARAQSESGTFSSVAQELATELATEVASALEAELDLGVDADADAEAEGEAQLDAEAAADASAEAEADSQADLDDAAEAEEEAAAE